MEAEIKEACGMWCADYYGKDGASVAAAFTAGAGLVLVAKREADAQRDEALAKVAVIEKSLDGPETADWIAGVRKEAAHQVATQDDRWKKPADWFWLVGYLAGKCLAAAIGGDMEKARHHTISTGAALLNWHASMTEAGS